MRRKAIGWVLFLSLILVAANVALAQSPKPSYAYVAAGMDGIGGYWELKDENLITLEDGDTCLIMWAGPDGAIDPPVLSVGSPSNGLPTGDDVVIKGGAVAWAQVFVTVPTFVPGETDSLGNQRLPIPGDRIYLRIFNDSDLTSATFYGDSDLYEVTGIMGENFIAQMPNDPNGPTTASQIFGQFFKVIGGIDPATNQTYKLKDPDADLLDDDLAQLVWAGPDGMINPPDAVSRMPGGDDEFIESWGVNEGMYPSIGTGVFRRFTASFDISSHGRPAQGDTVYVRLFNDPNVLAATYYGDSPTYVVNYVVGESLSVFYDGAVDCDAGFPPSDVRDFTIYGGYDPVLISYWPLVDIYGLRLHDDDVVQLIWAGLDTQADEMDALTGMPTGDDSLLATWGIGEGYAGIGTGRYKYGLYTYETHTKGGYPAQGDYLYLRVFEGSTIGEGSEALWYGESEIYEVQWEFNEEFYSFPDSVFDADTRVPWYRTVKIYGGLDSSMAEHPLTDSLGTVLEDGDLVQILWAGSDGEIDPMDETSCAPTDDDSLLTTLIIGDGYGDGTGLFKTELQTFCSDTIGAPGAGNLIYVRVFDSTGVNLGHYYGESDLHEVAYEQGEMFFCFSDSTDDTVIPNPAINFVEEWTTPTAALPTEYTLLQNYPNPFNPETDIQYQIPEGCRVQLSIYNVLGQEIYTLVDGERAAGRYTVRWFGTDSYGRELGSGIYFYRLKAGDFVDVRKMVLLK